MKRIQEQTRADVARERHRLMTPCTLNTHTTRKNVHCTPTTLENDDTSHRRTRTRGSNMDNIDHGTICCAQRRQRQMSRS